MEQGRSSKHGPRVDDELARESDALVEGDQHSSRVEELRRAEEPTVDERGLPDDPALARRELSRHLGVQVFPARRDDLLANAREHQAPEVVLALLARAPADKTFATVHELWEELAGSEGPAADLGVEPSSPGLEFEEHSEGRTPPAQDSEPT